MSRDLFGDRSPLRLLAVANAVAGAWLLAAPFVLHLPRRYPEQLALLTSIVAGAAVLLLSILHALQWQRARGAARANLMIGLVLAATPVLFRDSGFRGEGRGGTVSAVVTGAFIFAAAALSLAGSQAADADNDAPVTAAVAPVLWPEPPPGQTPRPFTRRADDAAEAVDPETKRRAWLAVALMIVGLVVVAFSFVLQAWPPALAGAVLGAVGVGIAIRVRILTDVSLSQKPGAR